MCFLLPYVALTAADVVVEFLDRVQAEFDDSCHVESRTVRLMLQTWLGSRQRDLPDLGHHQEAKAVATKGLSRHELSTQACV